MFNNIGFGNGVMLKEKNTNFNKPLLIPKGFDTWENIGYPASTVEQVWYFLHLIFIEKEEIILTLFLIMKGNNNLIGHIRK